MQRADLDALRSPRWHQVREPTLPRARLQPIHVAGRADQGLIDRQLANARRRRVELVALVVGDPAVANDLAQHLAGLVVEAPELAVALFVADAADRSQHLLGFGDRGLVVVAMFEAARARDVDELRRPEVLAFVLAPSGLHAGQQRQHSERQQLVEQLEVLDLLLALRLGPELRRDSGRVDAGEHCIEAPRDVRVHFQMRGADAVVDADAQRAAIDRHPLAVVLARDPDHLIGGAPLRLIPTHELRDDAAQVVDHAGGGVLDGPVAADRAQQDHALVEALRAVGDVLLAQRAEDAVDALGEELRAAGHQAAQGGAHRRLFELRKRRLGLAGVLIGLPAFRVADLLEPLVAALLRHVVEHVGQAQRPVPEVGIQLGDRAFHPEHLIHGLR